MASGNKIVTCKDCDREKHMKQKAYVSPAMNADAHAPSPSASAQTAPTRKESRTEAYAAPATNTTSDTVSPARYG